MLPTLLPLFIVLFALFLGVIILSALLLLSPSVAERPFVKARSWFMFVLADAVFSVLLIHTFLRAFLENFTGYPCVLSLWVPSLIWPVWAVVVCSAWWQCVIYSRQNAAESSAGRPISLEASSANQQNMPAQLATHNYGDFVEARSLKREKSNSSQEPVRKPKFLSVESTQHNTKHGKQPIQHTKSHNDILDSSNQSSVVSNYDALETSQPLDSNSLQRVTIVRPSSSPLPDSISSKHKSGLSNGARRSADVNTSIEVSSTSQWSSSFMATSNHYASSDPVMIKSSDSIGLGWVMHAAAGVLFWQLPVTAIMQLLSSEYLPDKFSGCDSKWELYPMYGLMLLILICGIPAILLGAFSNAKACPDQSVFTAFLFSILSIPTILFTELFPEYTPKVLLEYVQGEIWVITVLFFVHLAIFTWPILVEMHRLYASSVASSNSNMSSNQTSRFVNASRISSSQILIAAESNPLESAFDEFVEDETRWEAFKSWALHISDFGVGDILFYKRLQGLHDLISPRKRLGGDAERILDELRSIYEYFFTPSGPASKYDISIHSLTRRAITESFETGKVIQTDIFDIAEREVRAELLSKSFCQFWLATDSGKNWKDWLEVGRKSMQSPTTSPQITIPPPDPVIQDPNAPASPSKLISDNQEPGKKRLNRERTRSEPIATILGERTLDSRHGRRASESFILNESQSMIRPSERRFSEDDGRFVLGEWDVPGWRGAKG